MELIISHVVFNILVENMSRGGTSNVQHDSLIVWEAGGGFTAGWPFCCHLFILQIS